MAERQRQRRGAVPALCLVQFVDVMGVTVVTTALPVMLAGLGAPTSSASLVATGYAMFFGGLLMLGARLGDRCGHRRVLLAGLAVFAAASLVGAVAPNVAVLASSRCLQGAAAALSVPAALRLLSVVSPDETARQRAVAAWSAAGAAAGASGFLLGGLLTDVADWRTVFWVNVPLAVLLGVAVARTVPAETSAADRAGRLDLPGAILLTAAVMGVVLGASLLERASSRATGLAVVLAGVVLLAVFASVERRSARPLLPREAARHPHVRAGAAASALNTGTTSSVMTLATLYLQGARGASPTVAGLTLLPLSLSVVLGAALAAALLRRRPPRQAIALGLATIAVGDAALLAVGAGMWVLVAAPAVAGLGLGVAAVGATTLGTDVGASAQGAAVGAVNTAAQLGTAIGVAVLLLVAGGSVSTSPPRLAWACAAVTAALAAGIFSRGGTRGRPAVADRGSGRAHGLRHDVRPGG